MPLKKIVFFVIILASVFVINNLIHSIFTLWQKNDLIVSAKKELTNQQKENTDLKNKLTDVNKPEFVEGEARNKLFMTKAGEGVIVMPNNYDSEINQIKEIKAESRPNWQQWWEMFF